MNGYDEFLYLSRKTLDSLVIPTAEVVATIEGLIKDWAESRAWSAPKVAFTPPGGRYMMATLAAADDPPLLAVKALVLNPANPERGLDGINSTVIILSSETGLPVAVMDGNWVTAIRTAGLSAVAATRMARADSSTAAFIGCGVQAHSHLRAFFDLFPLKQISAFGRGTTNRDKLCKTAESLGLEAVACSTAQDAVRDADIVITSVTFSAELQPFLDGRWLKPGAFVSSTDLGLPWVPEGMTAFDKVLVDDLAQESSMPSPVVEPDLVDGDLPGLITGRLSGRDTEAERTLFVFRGMAIGDLALAALACEKAKAGSKGVAIGKQEA